MNSFNLFRLYKSNHNKIRLGNTHGDGYVIADLSVNYGCFIFCGVSDNIDFELDFTDKYNIPCIAFDGTINH